MRPLEDAQVVEDEVLQQQEVADDGDLARDDRRPDVVDAELDQHPHDREVRDGAEAADEREGRHPPEAQHRELRQEAHPCASEAFDSPA